MRTPRTLLIVLAWMMVSVAYSQEIRVECNKKATDDQFLKSQAILPIYKFTGIEIEPYSKFGLSAPKREDWFTITKMPNMTGIRDTGYTYLYFSGADNAQSKGYLLVLLGQYRRRFSDTTYFFIDRNNDFDFTNDGPPEKLNPNESEIELTLRNVSAPLAEYSIKLTRFKYGENMNYKKLLTEHYKIHSGAKVFTDINYCFREQRYNSITADIKLEEDSFTVGIKDFNVNGLYNDACQDKLYVGPYKSIIQTDHLFDLTPTIHKNAFEWNGKVYRFVQIESTGAYIALKNDPKAKVSNKLVEGKKISNFKYFNVLSQEQQLKKFKKQAIFLFFWDKESITDEDKFYLKKLHEEFEGKLKVIALNHGDVPKQVRITYYYDKYTWPVGYSSEKIAKNLFVEDVPHGIYLRKRLRLEKNKISPKEMYEIWEGNNKVKAAK